MKLPDIAQGPYRGIYWECDESILFKFFYRPEKRIVMGDMAYRKICKVIHIDITMPHAALKKNILHYPQLDTILMVEEFIRDNPGEYKKKSLWQHLPRKMVYQTFCVIFDYLLESGKIAVDREGHICWIWNPELVRKYLSKPHLSWRK